MFIKSATVYLYVLFTYFDVLVLAVRMGWFGSQPYAGTWVASEGHWHSYCVLTLVGRMLPSG